MILVTTGSVEEINRALLNLQKIVNQQTETLNIIIERLEQLERRIETTNN